MTQISWEVLKIRAEKYLATSDIAVASGDLELLQNALENMHFALELTMKAVIRKNGGNYPDWGRQGHNLESLMIHKFGNPTTSILAQAKKANQTSLANIGLSAWSMDCRYIYLENFDDMKDSIHAYKELYKWINTSLLK